MNFERLLTTSELANHLQVSKRWIYKRTLRKTEDKIPFVRVGGLLRFKISEVMQWLEDEQAK